MGLFTLSAAADPALADQDEPEEASVQEQLDVLTEEIARLREQIAIPETDRELESVYGMGPAASKVYGGRQGVSLGGYGEFYFAAPIEDTDQTGATNVADLYRFVTYLGYKFSPQILMNTEVEFEHDGKEISVEFAYLDFLLDPALNVRAGNLLVPMGFVNRMHEPPFYRGNFRPEIERRILPSTWHEMGLGIHGEIAEGLRYTAYAMAGLDAMGFTSSGLRKGRQGAGEVTWEDVAGVVAVDYDHRGTVQLGSSFYIGQADQNRIVDSSGTTLDVTPWIYEAHGQIWLRELEARALVALSHIDGAGELTPILFPTGSELVPEDQLGWYVEAAYDVAPLLLGAASKVRIAPWVRYEDFDLQDEVPSIAGRSKDKSLAVQLLTIGVDVKPHPSVVLKLDYVHSSNDADTATSDEIRLGGGFVF